MYKLTYTGKEYPESIKNMIEAESYKNEQEAETNKRITCALLNIAPEDITITKAEKQTIGAEKGAPAIIPRATAQTLQRG